VVYLTTAPSPAAPGELVAVNADTGGGILVSDVLNPQPYPPGPPSIGDGKVFVGDFNASLSVFELPAAGRLSS
jgi:outer membrane protein assembly factor BamB